MVLQEEKATESLIPLLDGENLASGGTYSFTDWRGRPADDRDDLGGWTCSSLMLGAYFFFCVAYHGLIANLALYLVDEWEESVAAAANTVTNLFGTTLLCSFLGAYVSDRYSGNLWGSIIFEILYLLSFLSISLVSMVFGYNHSSQNPVSRILLLLFYFMAITSGACFPTLASVGADQLHLHHERARYFTLFSLTISAAQTFAVTVIAFLNGRGLYVLGYWICTGAALAALVLTVCKASKVRVSRGGGSPLVQVCKVLVSAIRNRNVSLPEDPRFLHEVHAGMSATGYRKVPHTDSLSCFDKAAVRSDDSSSAGPWRLCTVTEVEEVKCFIRVMPAGLALLCVGTAFAQVTALFEVQAAATNETLIGGLSIAPPSMQVFYIAGALITGFFYSTIAACPLIKRSRKGTCTSLQLQGAVMVLSIVAMAVAAAVEAYRLHVERIDGSLISASWLVPQNFLLGISTNLFFSASSDFFYKEVTDGMRSMSMSLGLFVSRGVGSYLSSIFVLLVTAITTRDGSSGWLPDNLNDGHLDYFYWFLTSFLTVSFGLFLLYARLYTYREVGLY